MYALYKATEDKNKVLSAVFFKEADAKAYLESAKNYNSKYYYRHSSLLRDAVYAWIEHHPSLVLDPVPLE